MEESSKEKESWNENEENKECNNSNQQISILNMNNFEQLPPKEDSENMIQTNQSDNQLIISLQQNFWED